MIYAQHRFGPWVINYNFRIRCELFSLFINLAISPTPIIIFLNSCMHLMRGHIS